MKNVLFFSLILCSFYTKAQKIFIIPSLTHRSIVFELMDYPTRSGNNYYGMWKADASEQLKNTFALSIQYSCFNKKRMYLQLDNYGRITPIYYYYVSNGSASSIIQHKSRFKTDHILNYIYEFGLKKKRETKFLIGVGVGIMNTNTQFEYKYATEQKDDNGNTIIATSSTTCKFQTVNLLIGVRHKKFYFSTSVFATPDEDFKSNSSLIIENKIGYSFSFSKRKK